MIPLNDLAAQYAQIKDEIDEAVARVLTSGRYVLGPEVEAFEEEFSRFCGASYAVGVNSGTSALYLSLLAAGIGDGDEVITVPFTFEATVAAIASTGARVRFVDIEPHSLTMDVTDLEGQITERTKAIVPVHLFGHPADMDPIMALARTHGLTVIEDASQAHGATYKSRPVGGLGDLGCFSLYPAKNLGACGEGGVVVTSSAELADTVRSLRNWGRVESQGRWLCGGNYRLDAIQAAVLRVKLPHVPSWTTARRAIATRYDGLLDNRDLQPPEELPYATHVYHAYAVRSRQRDQLAETLQAHGIGARIHYSEPIHLHTAYANLGYTQGAFPNAEEAAQEGLSLPIYPELTDSSVRRVVEVINQMLPLRTHT